MDGLTLVAVGELPAGVLDRLAVFLAAATGRPTGVDPVPVDLAPAYDPSRGQHDCRRLLPPLEAAARRTGGLVLGVADVDLYSAVFTFVFGEARLRGPAGIMSLHRLRPTLYGLAEDPELLEARARREALHETGHLLGLVHCREPECVMRFSGAAEEVDLKLDAFCPGCRARILGSVSDPSTPGDRPAEPGNREPRSVRPGS